MDNIIPKYYKEYGLYTNKRKMLPNIIDGLLPVQRRILLTAHTIAKQKFVKTAKILGECMSRWHPHSTALGTAEWAVQNGFLDGDGQWGSTIGEERLSCAAPRYTSVRANKEVEELAFEYVNFVEWKPDEADPEPVAIPTMMPFCLMARREITSIAFGFKTEIPCYKFTDLIKRMLYLQGKINKVLIKPNITGCKILSTPIECESLLTTGEGKIYIHGRYKIDKIKKEVTILGWSPRTIFRTLFDKIDKYKKWNLLSNRDIRYIDESSGDDGTKIVFEILKQRNKDQIFEKMIEAISESLKASLSYHVVVVDGDNTKFSSVDEMLMRSYDYYKLAMTTFLQHSIKKIGSDIDDLKVIKKIRPYISSVIKTKETIEQLCENLSIKSKCSLESVKSVIEKYRIKRLLSVSLDIDELDKKVEVIQNTLDDIDNICLEQYNSLA